MKKIIVFLSFILLSVLLVSCKYMDFDSYFDKTVEIKCVHDDKKSYATGFFINEEGLILTNKHVIDSLNEKDSVSILVNQKDNYEATVYDLSSEYDLALLKIDYKSLCFKLDSFCSIGEEIYSIGNPNGLGLSLYKGIISRGLKNIHYQAESISVIQTDLEIYDGCSGGPLINQYGNVIGINVLRIRDNGNYVPGVSYHIPSSIINEYVGQYIN